MEFRLDNFGLSVVGEFLTREAPLQLEESGGVALATLYAMETLKLLEDLAGHPKPLIYKSALVGSRQTASGRC